MPDSRHKNRVMFNFFSTRKKYIFYSFNNDYPVGEDIVPAISFGVDNKIFRKENLIKTDSLVKPGYRHIKKRRDNRHAQWL